MRRRIGAYLLMTAAELEANHTNPRTKRVEPASVGKEITQLRRWAWWLRR